ncbi:hypothetical protein [Hymenobacter antarcticus]|uniref:Uncharacterized protein n=1 Tax=Hymenobacter antarcticus TaxID=486270 RepID=A0ABP7PBS5_9BACT
MKTPVNIGQRRFSTKKETLIHYKGILNSYKFGQSLNDDDFVDLLALVNYEYQLTLNQLPQAEHTSERAEEQTQKTDNKDELLIADIIVSKAQFNTKCFEVIYNNNSSCYISYIMLINRRGYTPDLLFTTACRNCIHKDMMSVKQDYFKKHSIKGKVKGCNSKLRGGLFAATPKAPTSASTKVGIPEKRWCREVLNCTQSKVPGNEFSFQMGGISCRPPAAEYSFHNN